MIYRNEKLRIVPFDRSQHMTEKYRQWMHDPETTRHNSHGLFAYTRAQQEAFVRDVEEGSRERIVWAIEIRYERLACSPGSIPGPPPPIVKDWKHVGNCSLQSINWVARSAEMAVVIGEAEARGQGFGQQACQWMIEHAFLRLGMNRVWTGTASPNVGMRRVCEKLGMKHEGTFKDGMFLFGQYVDVCTYGLTRKAWDAAQPW